jgi:hypothetical protein
VIPKAPMVSYGTKANEQRFQKKNFSDRQQK